MKNEIKLFKNKQVRRKWSEDFEEWYFSVIDVVEILTESDRPRKYWNDLKKKLKDEGSELSENIGQLKMQSSDGKMRETDVANTKQLLRLVQSIPSKKAEPFKLWLASVGNDRIDEIQNPELAIERAMRHYLALGYDEDWINLRLQSIQMRKELTDEWHKSGVKEGLEYAILTDLISKTWSGKTTKEYKQFKGLKKENLRDNMTNTEIVLSMLSEVSTKEIHKSRKVKGFEESRTTAVKGASVAKTAREQIEKETGKSVISPKNAKQIGRVKTQKELN